MNIESLIYFEEQSDTGGLTEEDIKDATEAAMVYWKGWENPTGQHQFDAPTSQSYEDNFRYVRKVRNEQTTKPSLDTYIDTYMEELKREL